MKNAEKKIISALLSLAALSVFACAAYAGASIFTTESYLTPPKEIADLVLAPRWNNKTLRYLSPDNIHYVTAVNHNMPQIEDLAKPFYILADTEFDYKANRRRDFTINTALPPRSGRFVISLADEYKIFNWKTQKKIKLQAPKNATLSNARWSPDGGKLAYFAHFDDATHIYTADAQTGKSKKLTKTPVLATLVKRFNWTSDGQKILTVLLPDNRGPEPAKSPIPNSPKINISSDGKTPTRTHRFLLKNQHDKDLLEFYSTGQLALINAETGKVQKIADPNMYLSINISPDMNYLRIKTMQKPFSYIVPLAAFPSTEQLWDLNGNVLAELVKKPLDEIEDGAKSNQIKYPNEPKPEKNEKAKRFLAWAPDSNGMIFLQREPKPDSNDKNDKEPNDPFSTEEKPTRKDRVMRWLPPYDENSVELIYAQENKLDNYVRFTEDFKILFLKETKSKTEHLFAVNLDQPDTKYTIYKYKTEKFHKNPGNLMTKDIPTGSVVRSSPDKKYTYLSGTQYFKNPDVNAPRPFVDKVSICDSNDKERIFESKPDVFEKITDVLDDNFEQVMTTQQTATDVPNSYLRNLKTEKLQKMTDNIDYAPEITKAAHKRIEIENADGYKLWVTVILPVDYVEGTKPPAMFWFYPRDYTSQKEYNKRSVRRYNKNEFRGIKHSTSSVDSVRSMMALTKLGYAYVRPDTPYFGVGKKETANNTYPPELRNNLWAIIDTLDKMALIDRDRLAIGGHSYGGFSTAHAMIHTPFFKAGIAGDSNFNRTLTPCGWQNERRHLWDARETYIAVSPIIWANRLHGAILMYHGMLDKNVGCNPVNSERMFHALNALGKKAALYMYPYEHHGPITEQTILDMWARWIPWLDTHVKNPEKPKDKTGDKDKQETDVTTK